MTIEEIRKEYENSPDIVKTFNTLIDVTMSEFYHNKGTYLESLELETIKNINFSYKPEIKQWHIDLIEKEIIDIIKKTHFKWENDYKLHKKYKDEFEYLCLTMADLKEFIHTPKFIRVIADCLEIK